MDSRILDTIRDDHQQIEAIYNTLIHSNDPEEQTQFQNLFTWGLARHTVGEELVVFPAIEKHIRDGMETMDQNRREHHTIKEQLKQFQDMSNKDPQFIPTAQALMTGLQHNYTEETTKDLVKLEGAITREESRRLAKLFNRTKIFLPTRAHPSIPDKPPFETAMGLLAAPVDQLADLFRRWPESDLEKNPSFEKIDDHDYLSPGPCKLSPLE